MKLTDVTIPISFTAHKDVWPAMYIQFSSAGLNAQRAARSYEQRAPLMCCHLLAHQCTDALPPPAPQSPQPPLEMPAESKQSLE
jgi:hypothetical protein